MPTVRTSLSVDMLGELQVRGDRPVVFPASKKTRALLAFLVQTRRPQRRDRLCELFWDIPDDPRGALRWSLSKLRGIVNDDVTTRLIADRERVSIDVETIEVDFHAVQQLGTRLNEATLAELEHGAAALRQPLLAGLDLPQHSDYQSWLTAERHEAERLRCSFLATIVDRLKTSPEQALPWCREWVTCEPLSASAAAALIHALIPLGKAGEAREFAAAFKSAAAAAGMDTLPIGESAAPRARTFDPERQLQQRQKIAFCTARDGTRIAYAKVGGGPPLVKAANWLNHLELDWDAPIWAPLFRELARDHCFIRYDERGNGLSDWNVADLSFPAFVSDLEAVVDAAKLERFPLIGISQGCAVAIDYAVRNPERVSHLILMGGYAAGWQADASDEIRAEREAVITLVREGWGRDDPVYRQIFSATFMPAASPTELTWFNEFQRRTTSPHNAARFLEVFGAIDVRPLLSQVSAPTLVMHAKGDRRIPVTTGLELAAGIPDAEFVMLDSDNHILLGGEPASEEFVAQVRQFID
jgi:pimeloyl-ACP methyl ester carboxylesterase